MKGERELSLLTLLSKGLGVSGTLTEMLRVPELGMARDMTPERTEVAHLSHRARLGERYAHLLEVDELLGIVLLLVWTGKRLMRLILSGVIVV